MQHWCGPALLGLALGCNQAAPETGETDPTETDVTETDPAETDIPETDPTETDPGPGPTGTDPVETDEPSNPGAGGGNSGGEGGGAGTAPTANPEPNPPDGPLMDVEEYFPMVDGASWTYRHTHRVNGQWLEEVSMSSTTFDGAPAFEVTDTPDLSGEVSIQTWQLSGTAILRVYREQTLDDEVVLSVSYEPGFLRFDTSWNDVEATTVNTYRREETQQDGTTSASIREQTFSVIDTTASVTVEAGSFENCLLVERVRTDNGAKTQFWFARGVGKVREEDPETQTTEELISFDIP